MELLPCYSRMREMSPLDYSPSVVSGGSVRIRMALALVGEIMDSYQRSACRYIETQCLPISRCYILDLEAQ